MKYLKQFAEIIARFQKVKHKKDIISLQERRWRLINSSIMIFYAKRSFCNFPHNLQFINPNMVKCRLNFLFYLKSSTNIANKECHKRFFRIKNFNHMSNIHIGYNIANRWPHNPAYKFHLNCLKSRHNNNNNGGVIERNAFWTKT
jgi:hypothetical protein